jgi:hypothetical protein
MTASFAKVTAGVPGVLLVSLVCACHGFGYGTLDPCTGVAVGAKYEFQIGAGHDGAEVLCAAAWGFAEGDVVTADIVRTSGRDTCQSGVAALTSNGGWDLALATNSDWEAGGGALLEGDYTIARGRCSGTLRYPHETGRDPAEK